jgi:hypothetical protein
VSEEIERPEPGDDGLQRRRAALSGMRARQRLRDVPEVTRRGWVERGLDLGLQAAPSTRDRDISLFSRGLDPPFAGINTFAHMPYASPGTGTPDAGGMNSREGLQAARRAAREGLIGMDLVEIAPPYGHADITALLGARVVMDVLATLVEQGIWVTG